MMIQLFDGFTYNTTDRLASCAVFFLALQGSVNRIKKVSRNSRTIPRTQIAG